MPDADLARRAVELSGLSARQFAEQIVARDERTVRRWLDGTMPVPAVARRWLERYVAERAPSA